VRVKKPGFVPLILLIVLLCFSHGYMDLFAPFSGNLWKFSHREVITNPYGDAEAYYDEYGVPHIVADDEKALAFAVGYVQAKDRLFQMDLHRRLMRGQLSEVFGEEFFESDEFHVKMDFITAAESSWKLIKNTELGEVLEAYCDGVNYYLKHNQLPVEFKLAGYKPVNWTPVDTLIISKEIAWGLTGNFWDLKRALIVEKLGKDFLELYPQYMNHTSPIVRVGEVSKSLLDWLKPFEAKSEFGSNNWVVSGNYTLNGKPILANDPHLLLTVPPVWYEMHLKLNGENVRGVTFPGVPLVIIGMNDYLAWGFTNVGADVIDFYYYIWNGSKYYYKGEWLEPVREIRILRVKTDRRFEEREVTVEKTVHGALIEKYGSRVAVAWTGLTATTEALAIYRYNHAKNLDEFMEGLRYFDVPAQNVVYADIEGNIMYYPAGKYPVRLIDGEEVPGNTIFNGSAGEGEWKGFKPYGFSNWEGFINFEEIPHLINPNYIATANQRIVYNYQHYLGDSMYFADPYRGMRIYEMLDSAVKSGKKIDVEYTIEMQLDTYSKPAEFFVPYILESLDKMDSKSRDYASLLKNWDFRMDKDSVAALIFAVWLEKFVNETFGDEFYSSGLDSDFYPRLFVLQNLPPDSRWFDDVTTPQKEVRSDIVARAMKLTVEEIQKMGYTVYGDYNRLEIRHPFSRVVKFFDYPSMPVNGSAYTVFNFRKGVQWGEGKLQAGSSWRMIVNFDENLCVIPGGNSGDYFSKHYSDQLKMWANGNYKPFDFKIRGEKIVFRVKR
jgi:penicillin amidase